MGPARWTTLTAGVALVDATHVELCYEALTYYGGMHSM